MPMHFLAELALRAGDRVSEIPWPAYVAFGFLLAVIGMRSWVATRTAPVVPGKEARNLQGKLILMTGAFHSPGYTVFTQLARRGARIVALTGTPVTEREHQLLHLATDASGNEALYAEAVDLTSVQDIKRFATEWEQKAATRRGALGEEIGRQPVDTVVLMPEGDKEIEALELVKALTPSLVKPTTVPGAPAGPVTTRTVYVLPSSFYAAADPENFKADGEVWRQAQSSLQTASRFLYFGQKQATEGKAADNKLAIIALSPGTTRRFLLSLVWFETGKLWRKVVGFSVVAMFYPLIWTVGKSASQAARAVEWAILAPLVTGEPTIGLRATVPRVRPGVLYRHTLDAGAHLRTITDEAVAKKLYEEDEARVSKKSE